MGATARTPISAAARPEAPATGGTGFCRVTVVAPDGRIDVALPDDMPVADLCPEILRLSGRTSAPGAPVGHHLVRRDGTVLDGARSLAAQRVLDGEPLSLRPFGRSLPPAVFDDVCDAVASAVRRDHALWHDGLTRAAGLSAGAALLGLLAFVLWTAHPRHDMHGTPGVLAAACAALLLALAVVRSRVYEDRASAVALGLGALANTAVAGSGLLPPLDHQGAGRLQALLACAAVLVAATVLTVAAPGGDSPFVAAALASAVTTLLVYAAIAADTTAAEAAALCAPLAVGAVAFLPGLSVRLARLPVGYEAPRAPDGDHDPDGPDGEPGPPPPVDAARIAARARRGHELLLGLVGGCALLAAGSAAVLGSSGDGWAQLLALATGLAMLMRAQLFRYTAQIGCALAAGLGALLSLGLGLALRPPPTAAGALLPAGASAADVRTVWLAVALCAAAGLATAIGLIVPARGVAPFWGRFLEIAESLVLLTLLPLCLAVLDVYRIARGMTG